MMKDFFENDRLRSGVMLILWGIFIGIILILFSCSPRKNNSSIGDDLNEVNIEQSIKKLLSGSIDYNITSTLNDDKEVYEVTYEDNTYNGYYQHQEETIRFKCKDNKCYKLLIDHEEELDNYFFKNDLDIFKLGNLADKFTNKGDYYIYENNYKTYKIYLNENKIAKIIINGNNSEIIFDININN